MRIFISILRKDGEFGVFGCEIRVTQVCPQRKTYYSTC